MNYIEIATAGPEGGGGRDGVIDAGGGHPSGRAGAAESPGGVGPPRAPGTPACWTDQRLWLQAAGVSS